MPLRVSMISVPLRPLCIACVLGAGRRGLTHETWADVENVLAEDNPELTSETCPSLEVRCDLGAGGSELTLCVERALGFFRQKLAHL